MNKFFYALVEIFFWLLIFLCPLFISILATSIFYFAIYKSITVAIVIMSLGLITGIVFAEKIRKKYGCSNYWGRILATPDIWPTTTNKESINKSAQDDNNGDKSSDKS